MRGSFGILNMYNRNMCRKIIENNLRKTLADVTNQQYFKGFCNSVNINPIDYSPTELKVYNDIRKASIKERRRKVVEEGKGVI